MWLYFISLRRGFPFTDLHQTWHSRIAAVDLITRGSFWRSVKGRGVSGGRMLPFPADKPTVAVNTGLALSHASARDVHRTWSTAGSSFCVTSCVAAFLSRQRLLATFFLCAADLQVDFSRYDSIFFTDRSGHKKLGVHFVHIQYADKMLTCL